MKIDTEVLNNNVVILIESYDTKSEGIWDSNKRMIYSMEEYTRRLKLEKRRKKIIKIISKI
jgi:hypothetical protein